MAFQRSTHDRKILDEITQEFKLQILQRAAIKVKKLKEDNFPQVFHFSDTGPMFLAS